VIVDCFSQGQVISDANVGMFGVNGDIDVPQGLH
jgi:hypothetical protein